MYIYYVKLLLKCVIIKAISNLTSNFLKMQGDCKATRIWIPPSEATSHTPPSEADSCSVSQEISHLFWNLLLPCLQ
jgi:hypothetical protein